MKTILVTGSNGQLGSELHEIAHQYPFQFLFTDVHQLDITSQTSVDFFFNNHTIDYCINAAAYTAVDKAESDQERAFLVNATAAQILASTCSKFQIPIIHISTDFVFDGKQQTPYSEDSSENPLSIYGESKLEGEKLVCSATIQSIIIRTSWLYSFYGKNFVKTMLQLAKQKETLGVIADQVGTPTYAADLAKLILYIIESLEKDKDKNNYWGTYHYSNEGIASWYDFAKAIFDLSNTSIRLNPIKTQEYPTPAQRPTYSVLDKSKIKKVFNLEIPYWRDSLACCIKKLQA